MKNNWVKACIIMTARSLILAIWMFSVAAFASKSSGQSIHEVYISVDLKEVTVAASLEEIENKTDFTFFYKKEQINDIAQKITVTANNQSVADILEQITKTTGLIFRQINGTIAVKKEDPPKPKEQPKKETPKEVQQYEVSGTVTGKDGNPLAGVNIVIKGRSNGTISDPDGRYTITVEDTDILVFSHIGYKTAEETVSRRSFINIQLLEGFMELLEVEVQAGYWTVKERERTGNISRITAEEIEKQPVVNPLQAMQGRMAGVEIVQESGVPGAGMQIQIRGQNSLRPDGNYPLYIIDGVPVSSTPLSSQGGLFVDIGVDPLNNFNLANIESIEVLKDADATAIYGSRGANGVVLITTKRGKEGKVSYEINIQSGIGKVSNTMKLLNTEQYLEMRNEAFINDGVIPTMANATDLLFWDQNRYTDWQKELIGKSAYITDLQTAVSGGNAQTSFRIGGGFRDETTVFPGDFGYKKIMGNFNLNHTSLDKRFQMQLSVNYGVDKNHSFDASNIVSNALRLSPNAPALYDGEGNLNWELDINGNPTFDNPVASLKNTQDIKSHNLVSNAVISYELVQGLNLKTSFGYTDFRQEETVITPKSAANPSRRPFTRSSNRFLEHKNNSWIIEPQLMYAQSFGNSKLNALIGMTWQSNTSTILGINGVGYLSEELLGNLNAAAQTSIFQDTKNEYKYNAIFGRIGYSWKEKYFLNLTGRRDGSSRFGLGNQFANFGAIGGAWIFSEEPFIRNEISFLSFGKLRASYGTTGNDQIGDYGYLATYGPITDPIDYRGEGGLFPTGLANPDYKWEVNKKLEAAIDLGFLRDRLLFSASWYHNRSSNQLVGFPLPFITGFNSVQANLPATVQNTGWELEMTTRNIQSNNFNWTTSMNLTIPKNKLVEYPNIEGSPYANLYIVGEPLSIRRFYQFEGVNPDTGLYQVLDVNEDGFFNQEDRIAIENLGRQYYGGLQNSFKYKGWDLDFLLEFVKQKGRDYNNIGAFGIPGFNPNGGFGGNQPVEVMDRWQETGDITNIQKFTQSFSGLTPYFLMGDSDLNITDASFIRLKNISLSYQFPHEWLEKTKLKGCRLYLQAQNLFTWTNYIGLDPQSPGTVGNLPALRMVTGGVQLNF
ncbi:TonB-dependent receptor [Sinomicrobium sp. M5D2P17]